MNTVTPETIDRMNAFADEIGAHFAKEPDERVMLVWLDTIIRNEIIDECCSPITRMRDVIAECTAIDRMLDRIERKRKEMIGNPAARAAFRAATLPAIVC